jgi:hypothetical protein
MHDNAHIESLFETLKSDVYHGYEFNSDQAPRSAIMAKGVSAFQATRRSTIALGI